MPKLPNNLSDEELLKILEQNQDVPKTLPQDELNLFIATFGLQEGTLKIPLKLVYSLYKAWSKSPLGEQSFYKKITLLMPNKTSLNDQVCLLLNKDTLKLNEELYKLIQKTRIKKERSDYYKKHFDNFLNKCKIEAGSDWISCKELHSKIYLPWSKSIYKTNPLSYRNFEAFCKLYFDTRNNETLEVAIKKVMNEEKENNKEEA